MVEDKVAEIISMIEDKVTEIRQAAVASEDATESTLTEKGPQKRKSKEGLFSLLEDLMDSSSVISDIPQEGNSPISIIRCQLIR